jgi:hypothetical protein
MIDETRASGTKAFDGSEKKLSTPVATERCSPVSSVGAADEEATAASRRTARRPQPTALTTATWFTICPDGRLSEFPRDLLHYDDDDTCRAGPITIVDITVVVNQG